MSRLSAESRLSSDASNPPAAAGWLEGTVAPFARRFGEAPAVRALREALPLSFVALLLGLAAVAIFEPGTIAERLRAAISPAFAVMSTALVAILAVRLAQRIGYAILPSLAASVLSFAFALPRDALRSFEEFSRVLGTSGLFTAIVCCLLTAGAVVLAQRRIPGGAGCTLGALAVGLGSLSLYALHVSIGGLLATLLTPLGALGDSFIALFLITGIEAALYAVGIHGPALLAAIVLPVYLNLQFANTEAASHHQPLPHIVVVSTFMFVFPGGCGATLPLVLLLLRSKITRLRRFAYATLVPSLFNVNEPVLFGLPLVYNPILAIPFVVAPLVLVVTTYAALAAGLVRAPIVYLPSTIPIFFNVFAATFDWRSVALLAINIALSGAIYYPFVRMFERAEAAR